MAKTALEFLSELRIQILTENISKLAMGCMLYDENGVRFTEDREDEYVRSGEQVTFVESQYAQELSWMVLKFREGLFDVISYYDKQIFYGKLAEAANLCVARTDDRTALLLAVLEEATLLTVQAQMFKNQDMKDEVLACVASLTDVADKA